MARKAKTIESLLRNDRPEVFIIFSFEKERSALDTVTCNTVNNAHRVARSGTDDRIQCNEVHLNYVKCIIVYTHITLALYRLD